MTAEPRLPIYAHWDGYELVVERRLGQGEPEVGDMLRIEIEEGCSTQRRPFRVIGKRDRLDDSAGANGSARVAVDLDVEPVGPQPGW
jgi:hypothetical protein